MPITRIKEWTYRENLTSADLNAEFDNIVDQMIIQSEVDASLAPIESDISTLQSDMTTAQGDIATLDGRVDNAETDIDTLQGDVVSLDGRVDALELSVDGAFYYADDYASFAAAVSALTLTQCVLIVRTSMTVAANVTVPQTMTLWIMLDGMLNVNSGKTVTIYGKFINGRRQCFTGSGDIVFGYHTSVNPIWWGAVAKTNTQAVGLLNIAAINAAMKSVASALLDPVIGGVVQIDDTYYIGGESGASPYFIDLQSYVTLEGISHNAKLITISSQLSYSTDYSMFGFTSKLNNFTLRNITIDGNAANNIATSNQGMYCFSFYDADGLLIENVIFQNMPGRNVVSGGWGGTAASKNITLDKCNFKDVGGAYPGNDDHQNDHSCIYGLWDNAKVINCTFINNDATFNPSSPARVVSAIEIHGSDFIVSGNTIDNFTHGIHIAPGDHYSTDIQNLNISNNTMNNIHSKGIIGDAITTNDANNIVITGNTILLNSTYNHGPIGIALYGSNTGHYNNLNISRNIIKELSYATSTGTSGVVIGDMSNVSISDNQMFDMTSHGVSFYGYGTPTNAAISILNNTMSGYMHTGIYMSNQISGSLVKDVVIDGNHISSDMLGAPYGVRIIAVEPMDNIYIGGNNRFDVHSYSTVVSVSGAKIGNYSIVPRSHMSATASNPASGIFVQGQDIVYHSDPAHSGTIGKVCTYSGAAYGATWGATTPYTYGQWVLMPGSSKVAKCIVAGTSGGSEPTMPALYGDTVVDGTVTWQYQSNTPAGFYTWGAIS